MISGQRKKCPTGKLLVKKVCKKTLVKETVFHTRENCRTVVQDPKSRQKVTSMANFGKDYILSKGPK